MKTLIKQLIKDLELNAKVDLTFKIVEDLGCIRCYVMVNNNAIYSSQYPFNKETDTKRKIENLCYIDIIKFFFSKGFVKHIIDYKCV